jgi:hypothetical protein
MMYLLRATETTNHPPETKAMTTTATYEVIEIDTNTGNVEVVEFATVDELLASIAEIDEADEATEVDGYLAADDAVRETLGTLEAAEDAAYDASVALESARRFPTFEDAVDGTYDDLVAAADTAAADVVAARAAFVAACDNPACFSPGSRRPLSDEERAEIARRYAS